MRVGVIVFPGSNCDRDLNSGFEDTNFISEFIWHKNDKLPDGLDVIAIPGGFSFGDYLRCGAIAANSPITAAIIKFAKKGGYVIGICNGFQILCETGLLPGALVRNVGMRFICRQEEIAVKTINSSFTRNFNKGQKILLPIAHHDGNYIASQETIDELEDEERAVFKYMNNPNGSLNDIAGILSKNRRILGMMPHPERAISDFHTNQQGRIIFESLFESLSTC
jgi:phosphoribosylformylglycinamidine synthase